MRRLVLRVSTAEMSWVRPSWLKPSGVERAPGTTPLTLPAIGRNPR